MTMSENVTEDWKKSLVSLKFPKYRSGLIHTNQNWLRGKQHDDEAEGLWRIYDNLYDFTNFISHHPGGSFWLEQTKGTDITEASETHHIKGIPPTLLEKYFVRKASKPRNYTWTLKENGFYLTLKRRVAKELPNLDYSPKRKTFFYHLGLVIGTVVFSVASARHNNTLLEMVAALCLVWQGVSAHNYFHQRDNWQMYTFNLTLMNFAEWRISHALSHHIYTNSFYDLEMSLFEPLLCWVPNKHICSKARRIMAMILQPIFYAGIFPIQLIQRFITSIFDTNDLHWHDLLGFSLPLTMFLLSPSTLSAAFITWARIVGISSFIFGVVSLNGSHHTPDIYHEGDALRKDRDWGLYQLDSIIDRSDLTKSHFMALTNFGVHALHHMFPTLDHGVLPQLYPIFLKTLEEFKGELRELTLWEHIIGQNQQLLRTKANPIPPCERNGKQNQLIK